MSPKCRRVTFHISCCAANLKFPDQARGYDVSNVSGEEVVELSSW